MTSRQREAIDKINSVRNAYTKAFEEIRGHLPHYATPTEWVLIDTLTGVHKIQHRTIRALIDHGTLESRPTDGFGREVRIVDHDLITY